MTFLSRGKGGENVLCKITILHFGGLLAKVVDHIIVNKRIGTQIVAGVVVGILQGQHISAISPRNFIYFPCFVAVKSEI